MKESENNPEPTSNGASKPGMPAQMADLVARMHEKRAEFAYFRAQFADFRSGYNGRLYDYFQFVCEMDDAFRRNPNELHFFSRDDFFNANRQKPDETNLLRHLLYFLADARTDSDRDKWLRPAAVLEHLRDQSISVHEIAQRLKDGGGFGRMYKTLPGKRPATDAPSDDLDVLRHDPKATDDPDVPPTNPGEDPNGQFEDLGRKERQASMTMASGVDRRSEVARSDDASSKGDPYAGASGPINLSVVHDQMKREGEIGKEVSPDFEVSSRRTAKDTIFVAATLEQVEEAFSGERVAIFATIRQTKRKRLPYDVVAFRVVPIDAQSPWPDLIDQIEDLLRRARTRVPRPVVEAAAETHATNPARPAAPSVTADSLPAASAPIQSPGPHPVDRSRKGDPTAAKVMDATETLAQTSTLKSTGTPQASVPTKGSAPTTPKSAVPMKPSNIPAHDAGRNVSATRAGKIPVGKPFSPGSASTKVLKIPVGKPFAPGSASTKTLLNVSKR